MKNPLLCSYCTHSPHSLRPLYLTLQVCVLCCFYTHNGFYLHFLLDRHMLRFTLFIAIYTGWHSFMYKASAQKGLVLETHLFLPWHARHISIATSFPGSFTSSFPRVKTREPWEILQSMRKSKTCDAGFTGERWCNCTNPDTKAQHIDYMN